MSNFVQHPKFFYTADEADAFGRALVGDEGVFEVHRIPSAPIEVPGPLGVRHWQQVAEYAVFTISSR